MIVSPAVEALEERSETLSASVEVASVFGLSVSQGQLAFPEILPGKTYILGDDREATVLRCRSNSGRPWFLKAHLVSLTNAGRQFTMPPAELQWRVAESTGESRPTAGFMHFTPFAAQPQLVYSAAGRDLRGKEVILRLHYSFTPPLDAPGGAYVGQIIFTMAEDL